MGVKGSSFCLAPVLRCWQHTTPARVFASSGSGYELMCDRVQREITLEIQVILMVLVNPGP